jgi:hypothetical protein
MWTDSYPPLSPPPTQSSQVVLTDSYSSLPSPPTQSSQVMWTDSYPPLSPPPTQSSQVVWTDLTPLLGQYRLPLAGTGLVAELVSVPPPRWTDAVPRWQSVRAWAEGRWKG